MSLRATATALTVLTALLLAAGADADARADGAGCTIHFYSDLADKEPLLLLRRTAKSSRGRQGRNADSWVLPHGDEGTLTLRTDEPLLIACPGKRNNISTLATKPASATATCAGGTKVEISGREYALQDLSCAKHSQGEALRKKTSCGQRNASLYELGFTVREEWHPLIDVCHEQGRSNTLYAQHVLQGEIENRRRKPTPRPSFDIGGDFYPGFSPNGAYRNVETTLRQLLGANAPIFVSPISKEIHRGHLSPDADFLLTPYRILTYFYINTTPMWGRSRGRDGRSRHFTIKGRKRKIKTVFYVFDEHAEANARAEARVEGGVRPEVEGGCRVRRAQRPVRGNGPAGGQDLRRHLRIGGMDDAGGQPVERACQGLSLLLRRRRLEEDREVCAEVRRKIRSPGAILTKDSVPFPKYLNISNTRTELLLIINNWGS